MEQYLWMAIGSIIVGFFAKTYWDVYTAYRAYMNTVVTPAKDELVRGPVTSQPAVGAVDWLLDKGDRFLHALLMSPTAR